MIWKLDGSSPVYLQIMDHIRRAVLQGEFPPGSRIPPVRELAAQARVNPNTMQRALMTLEQEGLLQSSSTAGRFVTADPAVLAQLRKNLIWQTLADFTHQLQALGLTTEQAAKALLEFKEDKT